jgi:phosphoglycolate phosphatase
MVGDSAPDVDAARAAGVPSIVLSYGYSEKPAGSLGADRLIHEFSDVPEALAEIWRAMPD